MSKIPEVVIVLTDVNSWLNKYFEHFDKAVSELGYCLKWQTEPSGVSDAAFCFLLGYTKILSDDILQSSCEFLVVHESALPHGRGWSPLTWQVLEGRVSIPVTLLKAKLPVDSGAVLAQTHINLSGFELVNELRELQMQATVDLLKKFLRAPVEAEKAALPQQGLSSWYPRRGPLDSKIDINETILSQFNLLRVVDNDRYPAWFEYGGCKFVIKISKEQ